MLNRVHTLARCLGCSSQVKDASSSPPTIVCAKLGSEDGMAAPVRSMAWSPQHALLMLGGDDGCVTTWSLGTPPAAPAPLRCTLHLSLSIATTAAGSGGCRTDTRLSVITHSRVIGAGRVLPEASLTVLNCAVLCCAGLGGAGRCTQQGRMARSPCPGCIRGGWAGMPPCRPCPSCRATSTAVEHM